MGKYIDADRLIDKILQLQKEYAQTEVKEDNKTMRAVLGGQCYTLMEVVKIIYSLQQEQQEVDLEKEATKFVQSKEFIESEESPVLLIARHFFNLGLNVRK